MNGPAASSHTPPPARIHSQGGRVVVLLAAAWIGLVCAGMQVAAWLAGGFAAPGQEAWLAVAVTLAQASLILAPVLLLAILVRTPRYRGILRLWLAASLFLLLLAPTRFLPATAPQLVALLQTVAALGAAMAMGRRWRRASQPSQIGPSVALAVSVAGIIAWTWLALGALGSPLDIVLAAAVGLAFGLFAAAAYGTWWLPSLAADSRGPRRDLFTGGAALGIALLIIASGYSYSGVQLLLMLSLPGLGWAAAASRRPGPLIGLATAAILATVDSNALWIIVADISLGAYFLAAGITIILGWLLGAALIGASPWLAARPRPALLAGMSVLLWLAAAGIYFSLGQPGFYGDRLFVIFTSQADVSMAATIQETDARRRTVYSALVEQAERTQAPLAAALTRLHIPHTRYYLVNAIEVHGGLPLRLWLERQPGVDRVLPSPILRPSPWPLGVSTGDADAPIAPAWNLVDIGATRVHSELGVDGSGIVIGQSDSGVEAGHPEFADRYRGRADDDYNWLDPWFGTLAPVDHSGHGTHTLGSILGATTGVAPGATWFACANLVRNLGNPALYLDCMQFMLAPYPQGGDPLHDGDPTRAAHILNNSWGCPQQFEGCDPESLLPAVQALTAAGIFVVASAGNDGPGCRTLADPLAIYDEVLSVGAVSADGNLAYFSSAGPVSVDGSQRIKPDLLAPGVNILSAFPNDTYAYEDGTSMAGPHVAGVIALMWSANPALIGDIATTERILEETAEPFTGGVGPMLPGDEPPLPEIQAGRRTRSQESPRPTRDDGACLDQINAEIVPNPAAGYGIVDAYAAVRASLDLAAPK